MTTVYFVRHAESDTSVHDDKSRPLTEKGMQNRELVTAYLLDKNIDVVLSSPYKRSIDTVKQLADKTNTPVLLVEDFRERRIDSGWIDDFNAFSKRQWTDFSYKLADGETLAEVQSRNILALEQVVREYPNKRIVVGSHGTALSTIINYYDSSFQYEQFEEIEKLMPWIVKFTFEGDTCVAIDKIDVFTL